MYEFGSEIIREGRKVSFFLYDLAFLSLIWAKIHLLQYFLGFTTFSLNSKFYPFILILDSLLSVWYECGCCGPYDWFLWCNNVSFLKDALLHCKNKGTNLTWRKLRFTWYNSKFVPFLWNKSAKGIFLATITS